MDSRKKAFILQLDGILMLYAACYHKEAPDGMQETFMAMYNNFVNLWCPEIEGEG